MRPLLLLVVLLLPPRARAGKIIGGQEARPHSFPYMAYVQIQTQVGATMPHSFPYMAYVRGRTSLALITCGGFLVREDFVMTAAHCLGSQMNVILGAHNISRSESTQQQVSVRRAIRHPRYNQQNNQNDIMLLQLEPHGSGTREEEAGADAQGTGGHGSQSRLSPGTVCTATGWGLVGLNRRTDTLRVVQLRVQRDGECHRRFDFYTGQTQICVGDPREMKSAFLSGTQTRGDSGGPLVCNNMAQGIVSYGNQLGTPPAVFTRVSSFQHWIRRTMRRFAKRGPD
ncbi:cathepsin G [Camelus ferus]|nr:cathepsin G [Camelus ferus]